MAETNNPINLLLNRGEAGESAVVESSAFSLTKVLATAATVLTPLSAFLVTRITEVKFTDGQIVTLILGVLAFLAVASAADVLARGLAAAADSRTKAAVEGAAATLSAAKEAATAAVKVAKVNRVVAGMQSRATAPAEPAGLLRLDRPIPGWLSAAGANRPLEVHAVVGTDGRPTYLCAVEGRLRWLREDEVAFEAGSPTEHGSPARNGREPSPAAGHNGAGQRGRGIWLAVGHQA